MRGSAIVALLALGGLGSACTESPAELSFSDVAGVYRLEVAAGSSVSVQPDPGVPQTLDAAEGVLELQPAWAFDVQYGNDVESRTAAGSYSRTSNGVRLQFNSGATVNATLANGVVIVPNGAAPPLLFEAVE